MLLLWLCNPISCLKAETSPLILLFLQLHLSVMTVVAIIVETNESHNRYNRFHWKETTP